MPETLAPKEPYYTVGWVGDQQGHLRMIDQTLLPSQFVWLECRSVDVLWEAIRSLRVRGAPAIGVAAAYGMMLSTQKAATKAALDADFAAAAKNLRTTQPPPRN